MINVFIPHRWNNNDYEVISNLLDRTKYQVRDYSVPETNPFEKIDGRFNVDPQIKLKIKYSSVVICSNRPSNSLGMSIDEIKYALSINKPVVAIKITENSSVQISGLNIEIIAMRRDSLEAWINANT